MDFGKNIDMIINNFRELFIKFLVNHNIMKSYELAERFLDEIYQNKHFISGSSIILCIFEILHPEIAKNFSDWDLDVYSFKTNKSNIDIRSYGYYLSAIAANSSYVGTYLKEKYETKTGFIIENVVIYDDVHKRVDDIFAVPIFKKYKKYFFIPNQILNDDKKSLLENAFNYICTYSDLSIGKNVFDGKTLLVYSKQDLIIAKTRITINEQAYFYIKNINHQKLEQKLGKFKKYCFEHIIHLKQNGYGLEIYYKPSEKYKPYVLYFMNEFTMWDRLGNRLKKYSDRGIRIYSESFSTLINVCRKSEYGIFIESSNSLGINNDFNNFSHVFIRKFYEKGIPMDVIGKIINYYLSDPRGEKIKKHLEYELLCDFNKKKQEKKKQEREEKLFLIKLEKEKRFQEKNKEKKLTEISNHFFILGEENE